MSEPKVVDKNTLVKLTIDGKELETKYGTTILEAAAQIGIHIPTLCYMQKLRPIGSCRVCSVEVEGNSGPVMSCETPVTEAMVVKTDTDWITEYRRQMIRFILVNHPLDCPVCERSGECLLQNRTVQFNVADQLFFTEGHEKQAVVDWGVIRYDQNLCVMCERCVRVCHEIQGVTAYKIDGTGITAKINTQDGDPLDCDFCGQCISVCPVGALNSGVVIPIRSWEAKKTNSICPHCAVGCTTVVESKNNMVARITSNDYAGFNRGNLCSRGRFGFEAFQSEGRLENPVASPGAKARKLDWDTALDDVAGKLKAIKDKHGPDSVAVIASERLTNEDAYLLQKVFRAGLGVNRIETLSNIRSRGLNSGMPGLFGDLAPQVPYSAMDSAGCFLAFGCDMEKENPVIANMARMVMRDKGTNMYIANSRNVTFFPDPMGCARYDYGAELDVVAALSGKGKASVDVEMISKALAGDGAPLIFIGKEIHDHQNSVAIVAALVTLADKLGGKVMMYREYANTQGTNDMGLAPSNFPGYMNMEEGGAHFSTKWGAGLDSLTVNEDDIFDDLEFGKIKALVLVGVDPFTHLTEGSAALKAMEKAEFIAVVDSFMTASAKLANVALPACVTVERDGSYTNNEGRAQAFSQAVAPVGESKPEWEIFQKLGARLGLKEEYKSSADITAEIADSVKGYEGLTLEKISKGTAFTTLPGGKAQLKGVSSSPVKDDRDEVHPFWLVTGNSLFHLDGLSRMSSALNEIEPRAFVEMSSEDAADVGIEDGAEVAVESAIGSVTVVARISGRSPKGIVFVPKSFENAPALSLINRGAGVAAVLVRKA